jgi:hypothetical protein
MPTDPIDKLSIATRRDRVSGRRVIPYHKAVAGHARHPYQRRLAAGAGEDAYAPPKPTSQTECRRIDPGVRFSCGRPSGAWNAIPADGTVPPVAFPSLIFDAGSLALSPFITHFSFSPENAYYPVLIWNFGTGSVMSHPFSEQP